MLVGLPGTVHRSVLKENERKKYQLFFEIQKEYLEASNIMYFLPSEYVSIRKYGNLKFHYS